MAQRIPHPINIYSPAVDSSGSDSQDDVLGHDVLGSRSDRFDSRTRRSIDPDAVVLEQVAFGSHDNTGNIGSRADRQLTRGTGGGRR